MKTHQARYVITENIERFETLLRDGRLDSQQARTVQTLLTLARTELADFDASCVPAASFLRAPAGATGLALALS